MITLPGGEATQLLSVQLSVANMKGGDVEMDRTFIICYLVLIFLIILETKK